MSKKKKKKASVSVARVPRLGPPVNLRSGGFHKTNDDVTRAEALRKALADSDDEQRRGARDDDA